MDLRQRRVWWELAAVVAVLAVAAVVVAGQPARGETPPAQAAATTQASGGFPADVPPPAVRPVIVVSGDPYRMGYEYGQQAGDMIRRNFYFVESQALPIYHTWDAILAEMHKYEDVVNAETPEVLQVWHGIADGSGLSFDQAALINLEVPMGIAPSSMSLGCENISAWGRATKGGQVICGANQDYGWLAGSYCCTLVAFPDGGNSFVSTPLAGEFGGNFQMNSKGVVCLNAAGQMGRPEDFQVGYPGIAASTYVLWKCDTAEQARDLFLHLKVGMGWNMHFADANGHAYVIEQTSAASAVRKAGDFGERDYLLNTNHFLTKTMQPAEFDPQIWDDSFTRYDTEEKLIQEDFGRITLGTMEQILGCGHKFYDGKKWHYDTWTYYSPENADPEWKTLLRGIALPQKKTVYLLQGMADALDSCIPYATGNFSQLRLSSPLAAEDGFAGSTPEAVADAAYHDAAAQIGQAVWDVAHGGGSRAARAAKIDKAKVAMWTGLNSRIQAVDATDPHQVDALYGQAITAFSQAQCYAEEAQDATELR